MNEKTKKIISYIGCALGGMALGIALLGGLSYCSTANKAKTESVNTILTKKNAVITTDEGGYTGYQFELTSRMSNLYAYDEMGANYLSSVYSVDTSTYTLTLEAQDLEPHLLSNGPANVQNALTPLINTWTPTDSGTFRFLLVEGMYNASSLGTTERYWSYLTFLKSNVTQGQTLKAFVLTNFTYNIGYNIAGNKNVYLGPSAPYILTSETADYWNYNNAYPSKYVFQDVTSYYQELGYQNGYDEGEATGYHQGLTEGLEYGQEFTTYQVMTQDNNGGTRWPSYGWTINTNAPSGMYGEQSSSTYQIANLLQYKTQDDDLHLIYLMLPIEDNDYFGHVYIYVYNQTDSVLEDTIAYGLRYYQTIADEKGWDYAYMFWTSGGTRTLDYGKVTAIYNDSLQKGYIQLSGLVYQETIYNTGYQAGLLAGQTSSNMNNVFSLFTTAFNAVGGFFELQVFGFLPLYWFFLAPLFVALIALILRMVKH